MISIAKGWHTEYCIYYLLHTASHISIHRPLLQMRQSDPDVVTALTHRPWSLSHFGDGVPRFTSPWKHKWMTLVDVLLDWAHHHFLWKLCGISAFLVQKDFVSP